MKIKFKKNANEYFDISDLTVSEIEDLKKTNDHFHLRDEGNNIVRIQLDHPSMVNSLIEGYPKLRSIERIVPYLSLKNEFRVPEFNDFNVITGLNGSGKTHFLKAVDNGIVKVEIDGESIDHSEIAFFDYQSFILINEEAVKFDLDNLKSQTTKHFEFSIREVINSNLFSSNGRNNISQEWRSRRSKITPEEANKFNEHFKRLSLVRKISTNNKQLEIRYSYQDVFGQREDAHNITDGDIHSALIGIKNKNNFLTDGFSILFRSAQIELDKIIHENDLKPTEAEVKYKEQFGFEVPWVFVNKVLSSYHSQGFEYQYSFEKPKENLTQDLKANLVNRDNTSIEYQNLSSGEKVLLTLSLFILQRSISKRFPKILLLDEIDATLHPSLCENLLETLKKNMVDKGTKIIFTTHNPSTVAYCDEEKDGIFIIEKSKKIEKQSKDNAIDILSSGIVSLSQGSSILDILLNEPEKDLFIFTEGNNSAYLDHTSKIFLDDKRRSKIKIIGNINSISSDDKLKVLFEFFQKINQKKVILFVWDCDCEKKYNGLERSNNVVPFIFKKNIENKIAKRGIENLFPEESFQGFINQTTISNGDVHETFDKERKKDFENIVLESHNEQIFQNFKPLFEKIESLVS